MIERYGFLFDECMTPRLAGVTLEQGIFAAHVSRLGLAGSSDRAIADYAAERDLVVVTNHTLDFRRIYAALDLHPGLILILPSAPAEAQILYFFAALGAIERERDLINMLVEVDQDFVVTLRPFPA